MKAVNNWLDIIQNYLLSPTCILCGNQGHDTLDLCQPCFSRLVRNINCCYRCAEVFPAPFAAPTLCGRCLSQTPAFDDTYAPFIHQDEIRFLITGLKFGAQYKNARLLGNLLSHHLKLTAQRPDCIIPIPLHTSRYRERGFNQALEIARTVASQLNLPLDTSLCVRTKNTPHQTGLSAKKRLQNVRNAFRVVNPIKYDHIAIIDDVMTTGSTANALAYVLKKAGANRVDVWVCARA